MAPVTELPPYPGTPRWVKLSAMVVGAFIVLALALMVTGIGGRHGPGRHLPSSDSGGNTQIEQMRR